MSPKSGGAPQSDGRRLRWQQHNAQRRELVISAAIELLGQAAPGSDIHVHDIAAKAGINRSVVYRYFEDRTDLDLAVQREICSQVGAAMWPALDLSGTPREIVRRTVAAYVAWAATNPGLMRFVERQLPGTEENPLDAHLEQIARQVEIIIVTFVEAVGAELSIDDLDGLEPWVFGMIGTCFESLRRWSSRDRLRPGVESFVEQTTNAVWFQIDGMAKLRRIPLPDRPIEQLLPGLLMSGEPA